MTTTLNTAEQLAIELTEEIDRFPQATRLESEAAAMLRSQAAEIERLKAEQAKAAMLDAPEGYALVPLRMTRAMESVIQQEDWEWADVLVAANAVTEEQYAAARLQDVKLEAVGMEMWQAYCDKKMQLEDAKDRITDLESALRQCVDALELAVDTTYSDTCLIQFKGAIANAREVLK